MKFYKIGDDKKLKTNWGLKEILFVLSITIFFFFAAWPLAVIFPFLIYFGTKQFIQHKNLLIDFANEMNLDLVESRLETYSMLPNLKSRLFRNGHSKRVSNLMVGEIKQNPLKIFNYFYTVGRGRNSKRYKFTVSEIEIGETRFPHIFLRSKKMWRYGSRRIFGANKDTRINLEDRYKKKFSLYCTENYEIEALQIFTPQLLDYLVEHGNKFSIEFYENKIYVFDNKVLRKKEDLRELYSVNKIILDNTDGLLHRLKNDFESLHEVYKI